MEHNKPHEIVNQLIAARDVLRSDSKLENILLERIGLLPEDDYCSFDRESLQLGAGYGHLVHTRQDTLEPALYGTELSMDILHAYFVTRPHNRYQDEQQIQEHQKLIHEAVINQQVQLPDHIDPYEVSAAGMFIEGYLMVTTYYKNSAQFIE